MYSIWKLMCFLNIKACQHILLHQIHKIMIFKKASYDPFNWIKDTQCNECSTNDFSTNDSQLVIFYWIKYSSASVVQLIPEKMTPF